jgi:hypothetical protein
MCSDVGARNSYVVRYAFAIAQGVSVLGIETFFVQVQQSISHEQAQADHINDELFSHVKAPSISFPPNRAE